MRDIFDKIIDIIEYQKNKIIDTYDRLMEKFNAIDEKDIIEALKDTE